LIFPLASALTQNWNMPESLLGWGAFAGMTLTSTLSLLLIFVSVTRIGPLRTALIMNLEPLVSTLASMALLGEVLTPMQTVGGVLMLVALFAFQIRR
jgi:drug/metabolite transporter (DMT)-like permease